ncbi:MAG: tetratricopeptide repeat protein [Desulfobacterales bacterium]|nr:MAG: tetratricopeptide repeat protein [Desulfobacterales bacterium]
MPAPTDSLSADTLLSDPTINESGASPADYVCLGRELKNQGKVNAALHCFQKALRLDPNLAPAAYYTANIFRLQKNPEQAAFWYKRTLQIKPDHVDAHNDLGGVFNEMARFDEAAACFKRAIALEPEFAEAHFNLGLSFKNIGNVEAAIACYRNALQQNPHLVEAYYSLGIALQDKGRYQEAAASLQNALHIAPGFAEAHYNLGLIYFRQARFRDAEISYRKALETKPNFPEALNNMGLLFKDQDKISEAIACYQKSLDLKPNLVEAHYNMGIALQLLGRYHDGRQYFQQALNINSDYAPARWLYLLSLPMLYPTVEDIGVHRQRFRNNLDVLIRRTRLDNRAQQKRAIDGIASTTNFYLQYQGRNDRDLQIKYGKFVTRVMAANYPDWAKPRSMPLLAPGEKIRIGYVSSFMRAHTVGEFLLGWLKNHRRNEFEIFCYHIGNQTDVMTPEFVKNCDHFYQSGPAIEPTAEKIVSDCLHVLVYTDIGMNAAATQLAGLRLAAVQCKGWGHPVTTGLPTMDFYLSSDLMEPEDADNHYSEKLIRLPNLALAYQPPSLPVNPKTRSDFGIRRQAFVYLTSQSLFKYLPQYDHVFAKIAARVPQAQLVFLSHSNLEVTRQFQERLAGAFRSLNLRFEDFCLFLPRLNFADFLSLNLASDVLLDSFCWSGGKTTLEGITCGLPVVTCPGKLMRGRHAYAMLKMMGIDDTIAANANEYIDISVRLGLNQEFYRTMRRRIEKDRSRLYNDTRCIQALEDFYRSLIRAAEADQPPPNLEKCQHQKRDLLPQFLPGPAGKTQPADARAYFQKGDQMARSGHYAEAIANYQKALQLKPDFVEACFKLAGAYQDLKNYEEAIVYYLQAVRLKPDFFEACYNAGLAYQALGKSEEAIAWYERTLHLKPDVAEAFNNLGQVLRETGKSDRAQVCFLEAIRLKPDFAESYFNLADLQYRKGQSEAAEENFTRALHFKPHMIEALNNLGNLYKDCGNLNAAIENYRRVIRLNPQLAEAYYNLGSALRLQGRFCEAIDIFKQTLRLKPDYAEAYNNLALSYKNQGLLDPAVHHFTRALQISPDLAEAHWNRSFTYLLQGDFARGWEDYEWRFKQPGWKTIYPFRYDKPRWEGMPARDKTIFVHDEQGLGDTLQFVRYLPWVKARCGTVILETRKSLMQLLNGFPGVDELVERSTDGDPGVAFDYYVPLLSLPAIFRTTAKNIPDQVPYLDVNPAKAEYWRHRLERSADSLKIGIVWAGRPLHTNDRNRSCRLDQFAGLIEIPGITLYGLQKGPAADQAKRCSFQQKFVNWGEEFEDFSDTAAAVACLDLVISVDTSVAHLAGALAKPVWVLLPFIPDWRWMMDRPDSPWYPTMRLFRQKKPSAWDETFLRVEDELRRVAQESAQE